MPSIETRETTMLDVAHAAGVGVATVDRVLNGRAKVRPETAQRVLDAAERLGFRRAGLIRRRISDQARQLRLGFVLQKKASPFYQEVGRALREAAEAQQVPRVSARVEYLEELTPRSASAATCANARPSSSCWKPWSAWRTTPWRRRRRWSCSSSTPTWSGCMSPAAASRA